MSAVRNYLPAYLFGGLPDGESKILVLSGLTCPPSCWAGVLTEKGTNEMGLRGRSIFGDQGLVFFVTTTIVRHDPIFGFGHQYYLILIKSLKFVLSKYRTALFAYVLMPSHIHLVIAMPEKKRISDLLRDFKKYTSTRIRQQLEKEGKSDTIVRLRMNAEGKKNQVFKLWMERFDDLVIENDKTLQIKIDYIHNNPVKAGFVDQPELWEYSSARNYILGDHSLISVSVDWEMPSSEGASGGSPKGKAWRIKNS